MIIKNHVVRSFVRTLEDIVSGPDGHCVECCRLWPGANVRLLLICRCCLLWFGPLQLFFHFIYSLISHAGVDYWTMIMRFALLNISTIRNDYDHYWSMSHQMGHRIIYIYGLTVLTGSTPSTFARTLCSLVMINSVMITECWWLWLWWWWWRWWRRWWLFDYFHFFLSKLKLFNQIQSKYCSLPHRMVLRHFNSLHHHFIISFPFVNLLFTFDRQSLENFIFIPKSSPFAFYLINLFNFY